MGSVIQEQKTALITGAASGVGFAIAKLCRGKGMHLALIDIDQTNLVKAKNALHELNPSLLTEAYVLDVADIKIWKATAQQIARLFPSIDLVVLNAGKAYTPQVQDAGRLNPWLDGHYWQKVWSLPIHRWTLAPTDALPDIRHKYARPTQWTRSSSAFTPRGRVPIPEINRHHGLKARHHQPPWRRKPSLQRFQSRH